MKGPASIGTRRESGLHRALKFRYAGPGGETEAPVGGYVADGVNGAGEIIEVQTGSFGPLKKKIRELTRRGPVRIIYPVIVNKYIEVFDEAGQRLYRRKSPRKGSEWDLFRALLYAPELPRTPDLRIELALVDVLEKRAADGRGSWRRKGQRITGRELTAWHGAVLLNSPEDYRRFVPFAAGETFTVTDLGEKARIPRPLAARALYVLHKIGVVNREGKRGNAWIYTPGKDPEVKPERPETGNGGRKGRTRNGRCSPVAPKSSPDFSYAGNYQASDISSASRLPSAKRSVTARRSSK